MVKHRRRCLGGVVQGLLLTPDFVAPRPLVLLEAAEALGRAAHGRIQCKRMRVRAHRRACVSVSAAGCGGDVGPSERPRHRGQAKRRLSTQRWAFDDEALPWR